MNRILPIASVLVLSFGLMFSVSAGVNQLYGQQNQTNNMTQQQRQQNQTTGIGTAGEIENLTAGNIPVVGNETDIESQNDTSVTEGLQKEQTTTDTNMTSNQTGAGGEMTNETTSNQTEAESNQTEKGPLEQIGETIGGIFGGNQSN